MATAKKEKPEAILFSAGGNDLFTEIPERPNLRWIWRALTPFDAARTAGEHVDRLAWDAKKTELRQGFIRVIAALGDYAPILIHGYDYLTASGEKCLYDGFRAAGPWHLKHLFERMGRTSRLKWTSTACGVAGASPAGRREAASGNTAKPKRMTPVRARFMPAISEANAIK